MLRHILLRLIHCAPALRPGDVRASGKSRLISIAARKSALNLADTWKKDIPARKSALFMAIIGTKQVARALWRSSRSLL